MQIILQRFVSFKNWKLDRRQFLYAWWRFFSELEFCWKITSMNVPFDSIERLVRWIMRWKPDATLVIFDPSKEILNEKLKNYFSCILLLFLKMKRLGKFSKGGLLLNVIRAGAFYLFRYIKHVIKNKIIFVWTIKRNSLVWTITRMTLLSAWGTENRQTRLLSWMLIVKRFCF